MNSYEIVERVVEIERRSHRVVDPFAAELIRDLARIVLEINGLRQSKIAAGSDDRTEKAQSSHAGVHPVGSWREDCEPNTA